MAEITASAVKELREKTGLPMMDCKKALTESQGDVEKAIEWLRIRGKKVQGEASGPFDLDRADCRFLRARAGRRGTDRPALRKRPGGQ